jgi:hypothetical protein
MSQQQEQPTTEKTAFYRSHYETAKRAYGGTSFSPEKRAENTLREHETQMNELSAKLFNLGANVGEVQEFQAKYTALFVRWLHAHGRCISTMITGPSNFPVRRAEKANAGEHYAYQNLCNFCDAVIKRAEKKARAQKVEEQGGPLEIMKRDLAKAESRQIMMKEVNAIIRKHKTDAARVSALVNYGIKESLAAELVKPDYCGRIGFASYQLTNNLANIKRMQERVKVMESKEAQKEAGASEEVIIKGVKVVRNVEVDRLQLFFEDKPAPEVIASLKKHGFKWAPSVPCWQRQITGNAIYSMKSFFSSYNA